MAMITSPQNSRIKATIRLRHHRERVEQQRFVIDGSREIAQAIQGEVKILEAYVCESHCHGDCQALRHQLESMGATMLQVNERVWEKLAFGNRRDGILTVAHSPDRDFVGWKTASDGLIVVLEGVEKPGNVGAVIRSADGAGACAVIIADGVSDLFNPNTIRASLGTVFRIPVVSTDSESVAQWLRERNYRVFVATVGADRIYSQCDLTGPTAIVLGSESHGASDAWKGDGTTEMHLPMLGHADSLNVSASAAILLYEAQRQRSTTNP